MPVVKTYSVTEEAYLAAANLESVGIEALIVDQSSFDSSLLGATSGSNTISLEVAEDDLERADEILREQATLAAAETAERELEDNLPADGKSLAKMKERFRTLIVIDVLFYAVGVIFPNQMYDTPPTDVEIYLYSLTPNVDLLAVADLALGALTLMSLFAAVLAYRFHFLGRMLYTGVVIWAILDTLAAPPYIAKSIGDIVNSAHWLVSGGILAIMYLTPLSEEFRRRKVREP